MKSQAEIESSVSRETLEDLHRYEELLLKWTTSINLISRASIPEVWSRHILDSLQLWPLLPHDESLMDIGSGGGLPGLVIAIAAKHDPKIGGITFLESDRRKSAFLRTVVGVLDLPAEVISERIEIAAPQKCKILTARALASCNELLFFASRHLKSEGKAFFLKGARAEEELEEARRHWRFSLTKHTSKTDKGAVILEIGDLSRA